MRRGTAGMTSVRSTEPRHSARAPCSRCRKPITPVRIELASALRAKQINGSVTVPWTSLQHGALGFRAQRATVRRSTGRPRLRHGRGSRCSRTQPRRRTIRTSLPSKLPVVARNRATRSLPSARESGSNGGWSGHSESQMPQCRPARLAGSPPACGGAAVVLRGPVWPGLVQQHSELGADGRCKAAWLPPSSATSEEAELRFGSTARSDRSMEPAARELELRPSQRIVQPLAETLRWFRRVFRCIGM